MAEEYIGREALIKEIGDILNTAPMTYAGGLALALNSVRSAPAADVQPVRHGRWQITEAYPHNVYCSECHARCAQTHWAVWEDGSLPRAFCPNCGAVMDGDASG